MNRSGKALVLLLFSFCSVLAQVQPNLINFKHLEYLTESIEFYGDTVSVVHVYADFPVYRWADAGEEGIACVDDAARAAVVYLRHYELTHNESSLAQALSLLKFVVKMQADDGEFYNFIYADHSINRQGKTSFKSFGWWAARGIWSMSLGYRVMKDVDPRYADLLKSRIALSIPHVEALMKKYGEVKTVGQLRIPQWLLYESGADVTSELLLGLTEYYRATNDARIAVLIRRLADGLMMMQDGSAAVFPYGLHRSWETTWHSWGNSQSCALAYAGKLLGDTAMVASAEREARTFYSRLIIEGMSKEWDCTAPEKKSAYEQIAYGIRPMVLGLLRLYDATGNEQYQKMAGLAGSWLFGNNILHEVMYDKNSGRCYDGITDATQLNRNSGAESTIEALYTLVEMKKYPIAMKYLGYNRVVGSSNEESIAGVFKNLSEDELTLTLKPATGDLTLREGNGSR